MDVHGTLSPSAATGFIEINAMRLKEYNRVHGTPHLSQRTAADIRRLHLAEGGDSIFKRTNTTTF